LIQHGPCGGANVLGSKRYDNGIIYEIDQVLIPVRFPWERRDRFKGLKD
jgi:hypothetical protein